MNKTHFLKLGLVAFTVIAILSFPVLAKDDTQNGKLQNEKIRLLSVSDTPDPFSPKVTSVSFTGNFEVKRTDGLGSESEEKKFRFFIRHTWIIIDSKTNQEINRLVGEIDIVAPPKGKAGYFPVTVSKSWDGTDCQSNIVSDGIYQYSVSGELYREKISKEKNDKEPPLKLIGYSEFLNGTITLDNSSPSITDLTPIPDSILNNARPVISAKYSDGLSGVDIASVKLTLDNVDITDSAEVTESGIVFNTANPLTDV